MELGLYNDHRTLKTFTAPRRNTLVIGAPQTGKTTLLTRLVLDDIHNGLPVTYIDPSGTAIEDILSRIPKDRQQDVLLIDPSRQPFALNIFANISPDKREMFASTVLETVKGVWGYENMPTPVLDQYLRATLHTALTVSGTTFLSLKFLLTSKPYRKELLSSVSDLVIKDFWSDFDTLTDKEKRQDIASTINKLRAFLFSLPVRNCLDQKTNALSFKDKIVLVSLRTRELGKENASLLGALILSLLYIEDNPQTLYIDGGNFGTAILGTLLTSCPNLTTVVAVQFLAQMREDFKPALLGGVQNIVTLRTSNPDADYLRPYLNIRHGDLGTNELARFEAYACIDGLTTTLTLPEHLYPETHQAKKIRARCLSQCTAPLNTLEKRIARFINV